jgi:hypothetical protein
MKQRNERQTNPQIQMKRRTKNSSTQTDAKAEQATAQSKPPETTPEQIQRRAHEIFEARGGEPGHELDDWLLAEHELKAEIERGKEKSAQ